VFFGSLRLSPTLQTLSFKKEGAAPKSANGTANRRSLKYYYNRSWSGGSHGGFVSLACDRKAAENLWFSLDRGCGSGNFQA
jgi:hypothetical protein